MKIKGFHRFGHKLPTTRHDLSVLKKHFHGYSLVYDKFVKFSHKSGFGKGDK